MLRTEMLARVKSACVNVALAGLAGKDGDVREARDQVIALVEEAWRMEPDDTEFLLKHATDLEEAVGTAWSPETATRIREIALAGQSFDAFQNAERHRLGEQRANDGGQK